MPSALEVDWQPPRPAAATRTVAHRTRVEIINCSSSRPFEAVIQRNRYAKTKADANSDGKNQPA